MTSTDQEKPKTARPSSSDKAAATDLAARGIIAAEKAKRDKKTSSLRALRLERANCRDT